jgi:hypothetical protein
MTQSRKSKAFRQERAIAALLTEPTFDKAAKSAGIARRTLYRWLNEPEFAAQYRQARRKGIDTAIASLEAAAATAVKTLLAIVEDSEASSTTRRGAARDVLQFAFKGRELFDLQAQFAEIERKLA